MLRTIACIALLLASACADDVETGFARALVGRGRLACVGTPELCGRRADGTVLVVAEAAVKQALVGTDPSALATALERAELQGVVVGAQPEGHFGAAESIASRLAKHAQFQSLSGVYVSPIASLYVPDPRRDWSPALRVGLAQVARRLLAGEAEPKLTSFPEVVRRVEPVEVMVLLRSGTRARLWRSARGSSFARALLTAADVARKRWTEREQAMGGPLAELLPTLTVEVSLLVDDGELGSRDPAFIDRAVGPQHGVAYEQKGAWRYVLPEATHHPEGIKPSEAYRRLFAEDGLPDTSLGSRELRLYRMAARTVGVSEPAPTAPPDDILD
jgi:hypothetical protein